MKKVFLSLGFKGKDDYRVDCEIGDMRDATLDTLVEEDEIIFVHNHNFGRNDWILHPNVECLGEAIKKMSDCDLVVFANDWQQYEGCKIEHQICMVYGIPIYYMDDWDDEPKIRTESTYFNGGE